MKELTIEEKAKRYDEAYKVAKNIHIFSSDLAEIKRMEEIFPELKEESEDERIRKRICKLLWDNAPYEEAQEYIAWLEKQNEQKPVIEMKTPEESLGIDSNTYNKIVDECIYGEQKPAWSEEDERIRHSLIIDLSNAQTDDEKVQNEINEEINWLKSLKYRVQPQQEWSKEDERIYRSIMYSFANNYPLTVQQQEFVKSFKDRYTWKPSDEQMRILDLAIRCGINRGTTEETTLVSLFNDLKKLREE